MATHRKGNVFRDLGFSGEEAIDFEVRIYLVDQVVEFIKKNRLTQQQAADFFGIHRPKVSDLMRGKIANVTADYLIKLLLKTGGKIDVKFRQPAKAQVARLIRESAAA